MSPGTPKFRVYGLLSTIQGGAGAPRGGVPPLSGRGWGSLKIETKNIEIWGSGDPHPGPGGPGPAGGRKRPPQEAGPPFLDPQGGREGLRSLSRGFRIDMGRGPARTPWPGANSGETPLVSGGL